MVVRCEKNYFVSGSPVASCSDFTSSTCEPCECNVGWGSVDGACADISGQCRCKPGWYGVKCENRDCQTEEWGQWGRYV